MKEMITYVKKKISETGDLIGLEESGRLWSLDHVEQVFGENASSRLGYLLRRVRKVSGYMIRVENYIVLFWYDLGEWKWMQSEMYDDDDCPAWLDGGPIIE